MPTTPMTIAFSRFVASSGASTPTTRNTVKNAMLIHSAERTLASGNDQVDALIHLTIRPGKATRTLRDAAQPPE